MKQFLYLLLHCKLHESGDCVLRFFCLVLSSEAHLFTVYSSSFSVIMHLHSRYHTKATLNGTPNPGYRPINLSILLLAVTNKKPTQASITKVKQFEGSTSFVRRSQWMLEQLRQVNGIDPNRDSAEFDLLFENTFDQWVASTASEKCTFFQILHHTCQRYLTDRKPEFINCQSKIMGGNSILHSAADSVTSAVQKASQALNERGERLGRAEEKTEDLKNSAQQFAETAHKLAMKHKC
ncbi:syntaxin-binding protein 6 isoform X2 [Ochotona curzoniae]|uniref:syntaxin-binding protein 6 isoform X2 n=1 Tax=Ochotona curzoniae TaxID=130825 RepID=UPI001B34F699|nr:syntaxin-binding protein 6 isoform X2 [Ochotona curzoniae]